MSEQHLEDDYFDKLIKEVEEYYDDDARYFLAMKHDQIYFCHSNHHNGKLYVMFLSNLWYDKFLERICVLKETEGIKNSGIVFIIEKALKEFQADVIGYGEQDV